jgi:hypothetical protein
MTPNFTGCNSPPASAVTMSCTSANGVICAPPAPLSSGGSGTTAATGSGNHGGAGFAITYSFRDSWRYLQGASCSIGTQIIYTEP